MPSEFEFRDVDIGQEASRRRFSFPRTRHPILLAMILGGLFVLPLVISVLILRIDDCNYDWSSDYSGVVICLPPFILVGAALGAVAGIIGQLISTLLDKSLKLRSSDLIGTTIGYILAAVLGVAASFMPSFMLAFPDC